MTHDNSGHVEWLCDQVFRNMFGLFIPFWNSLIRKKNTKKKKKHEKREVKKFFLKKIQSLVRVWVSSFQRELSFYVK